MPASGAVRAFGIAGPKMRAAGCEVWADSHELAVMGLIEPLAHLPRLLPCVVGWCASSRRAAAGVRRHRRTGVQYRARGAAAPRGIPTVQYVSPQVWAWRQGRVRSIAAACDLVLCLFPFETEFYARAWRARRICRPSAGGPDSAAHRPRRRAPGAGARARGHGRSHCCPAVGWARCSAWARISCAPHCGCRRSGRT